MAAARTSRASSWRRQEATQIAESLIPKHDTGKVGVGHGDAFSWGAVGVQRLCNRFRTCTERATLNVHSYKSLPIGFVSPYVNRSTNCIIWAFADSVIGFWPFSSTQWTELVLKPRLKPQRVRVILGTRQKGSAQSQPFLYWGPCGERREAPLPQPRALRVGHREPLQHRAPRPFPHEIRPGLGWYLHDADGAACAA